MNITSFTLNKETRSLSVQLSSSESLHYSFEFLRVFSPSEWQKSQPALPSVFHKKQVQITRIESVGKHGYRFIFSDGHKDLFTVEYLLNIAQQQESLWASYLSQTNNAAKNREQAIDITQL